MRCELRKTLAALTIVGLPFGMIATTAAPAMAYECEYALSDDIVIDCNRCDETAGAINKVSRKVTGDDAVMCLQ